MADVKFTIEDSKVRVKLSASSLMIKIKPAGISLSILSTSANSAKIFRAIFAKMDFLSWLIKKFAIVIDLHFQHCGVDALSYKFQPKVKPVKL